MQPESIREVVKQLSQGAHALAALAAALEVQSGRGALDPELAPYVHDVVVRLGVTELVRQTSAEEAEQLVAELRVFALTNRDLFVPGARARGWSHADADVLLAAGAVSASFPQTLASTIAPRLSGLEEALAREGASFLDVGAGVAAMSIEMARLWPNLRVVAIEPWRPALALARNRVAQAGLSERVELREQAGEALQDEAAFDLAWVPSVFIPGRVLPQVIERVCRALRPGGWVLVPRLAARDEPLAIALARLRTALFGGWTGSVGETEELLERAGLRSVRHLPPRPGHVPGMIVGQRG